MGDHDHQCVDAICAGTACNEYRMGVLRAHTSWRVRIRPRSSPQQRRCVLGPDSPCRWTAFNVAYFEWNLRRRTRLRRTCTDPGPTRRTIARESVSVSGPRLPILAAASLLWAINEAVRLWRTRPANTAVLELFLAERYRLSTAAAIIGLSNGLLYALHGPWAYTRVIQNGAQHLAGSESKAPTVLAMLAMAMFVGMLFSTWQRDNFKLEWRPGFSWFLNVVGGTLRVWVLRRRTAETTR